MVPPARTAPGDEPLSPGPPSPFPSGEPTAAATASSSSSSGSPNGGPRARRARRLPAERVSPARRSGLAAAAAAGRRADQRAARSAGHGGRGRRRPGARRVDRGVPEQTRRAGRLSSPQRASLATNRRRQRRRRHLHFCPSFSVSQAWAPTGGGEGRRAGHRRRGPARGAGLRETGGRAAAIGRLNVAGPRRCKALAYWRAGPRARPSPPPASGGGAGRRVRGSTCSFRTPGREGTSSGAAFRPRIRHGSRGPGWSAGGSRPLDETGSLGKQRYAASCGGLLRKGRIKTGERGPGGDFVFLSLYAKPCFTITTTIGQLHRVWKFPPISCYS